MKWTPWIRVVESNTVRKMRSAGGIWVPLEGEATEPIGTRIIETPENVEHTEMLRDPRSGFIAYVPPGQHQEGRGARHDGRQRQDGRMRRLPRRRSARAWGPCRTSPVARPATWCARCTTCRQGRATGSGPTLMKPVVAKLNDEDFVNIAAYVASRMP